MKISEMVNLLNEIKNEFGDLDCWYAKDEEGNGYYPIEFDPSVMYKPFKDEYELCSKDTMDEYIQDNIDNFYDGEADEEYEPLEYGTVVCVN